MASFIDIFNPSFFMFLGIVVLVAALLIVYFESKMREQNHKISSMFSLVTAITDELNSVKMIALSGGGGGIRPNYVVPEESPTSSDAMPTIEITLGESITLIEVSDDEDSEEEDGEEEDSSSSSDESDSDSDEVKESPEIIEIGDLKLSDIKILNVNLMSGNSTQSFWEAAVKEIIECSFEEGGMDDIDAADSFSSESSSESGDDSDDMLVIEEITVIKEEPEQEAQVEPEFIDLTGDDEEEPTATISVPEIKIEPGTLNQLDLELKSIHISSLEEPIPSDSSVIDYTKASLNKLRQVVVLKGLVEDSSKSSKLKKGELLKLLGVSE
jgi:hypothetical protein